MHSSVGFAVPLLLLFAGLQALTAQDFRKHRWKERLLVVVTPEEGHPNSQKQLEWLREVRSGMEERRILLYRVRPEAYATGLDAVTWSPRRPGPVFNARAAEGFQLLLIGLDGGVKLRSNVPVAPDEIWALIDSMPMRKAEMRNKGRN